MQPVHWYTFDVTYVQIIVVSMINSWFMAGDMCLLTNDSYRTATQGQPDYFGNDIFRQIIYKTWPFSKAELTAKSIYVRPQDHIELTAHQIAFVDVKVRTHCQQFLQSTSIANISFADVGEVHVGRQATDCTL